MGYGNLIVIDPGDGFQTAYGHQSQSTLVSRQLVPISRRNYAD